MKQGIFWIASYPRSGNTWTRAFLAALEDAIVGRPISSTRLIGVSERSFHFGQLSKANLQTRLAKQVAYARSGPVLSFLKTHSARLLVEGLPTIAAEVTAGAVYIVRDPRDMIISFAEFFGVDLNRAILGLSRNGAVSIEDKSLGGFEVVGSWEENVVSWTESRDTCVLRYEDIQTAPVKAFSTLVRHIGWQPTLVQMASAVEATSFDRMQAAKWKDPHAFEGIAIGHGTVGRWQSVLTPEQVKKIEDDHRELMTRFGYL